MHFMARSIFAILDDLTTGLNELKDTLAPLAHLAGNRPRPVRRQRRHAGDMPDRRPKHKPVSRAVQTARRLQGKYLAGLRLLTKPQRAQVKARRTKQGIHASLRFAHRLAKKKG